MVRVIQTGQQGMPSGRLKIRKGGVAMAKKKNCRRTTDENAIHIKAVKMRKMTDEQLVHYVEDRTEKARSEWFNKGRAQASKAKPADIVKILKDIRDIRGIGTSKLTDIGAVLEKHLEVDEKC